MTHAQCGQQGLTARRAACPNSFFRSWSYSSKFRRPGRWRSATPKPRGGGIRQRIHGWLGVAAGGLTVAARRLGVAAGGLTVAAGGLTVSARRLTVAAGGLAVAARRLAVAAGGLAVGRLLVAVTVTAAILLLLLLLVVDAPASVWVDRSHFDYVLQHSLGDIDAMGGAVDGDDAVLPGGHVLVDLDVAARPALQVVDRDPAASDDPAHVGFGRVEQVGPAQVGAARRRCHRGPGSGRPGRHRELGPGGHLNPPVGKVGVRSPAPPDASADRLVPDEQGEGDAGVAPGAGRNEVDHLLGLDDGGLCPDDGDLAVGAVDPPRPGVVDLDLGLALGLEVTDHLSAPPDDLSDDIGGDAQGAHLGLPQGKVLVRRTLLAEHGDQILGEGDLGG